MDDRPITSPAASMRTDFGSGAVADVATPGRGCLVLLVAEVLGQLLLQRRLQNGGGDRLEQPVQAGQVLTAGRAALTSSRTATCFASLREVVVFTLSASSSRS